MSVITSDDKSQTSGVRVLLLRGCARVRVCMHLCVTCMCMLKCDHMCLDFACVMCVTLCFVCGYYR